MKRQFDLVDANLGTEPTKVGRSGRLILRAEDGTHVTLANSAGKLSKAGKRYYEKSGKTYNQAFDPQLPLVRRGAREFVQMRDGTERLAILIQGRGFHVQPNRSRIFQSKGIL